MQTLARIAAFALVCLCAQAQTIIYGPTAKAGTAVDLSGASKAKLYPPVTTLPATCEVGEIVNKTNETAGKNLYLCTSTNTWTMSSGEKGDAGDAGKDSLPCSISFTGQTSRTITASSACSSASGTHPFVAAPTTVGCVNGSGAAVDMPFSVSGTSITINPGIAFTGTCNLIGTGAVSGGGSSAFSAIIGDPTDNSALSAALSGKQAAAANLTTYAGKTPPSGGVVGTTDTQALTGKTVNGVTPTQFGYLDMTSSVQTQINGRAPLASPGFSGTPTAPTASARTASTQVATTAYADSAIVAGSDAMTFAQSGTGASTRTIRDKLRDFVSVKDFGAQGNGTTNDAAAFQAAHDASTYGTEILIPPGNYVINSNINITRDNISWRGVGNGGAFITAGSGVTKLFNVTNGATSQVVLPQFDRITVDMNASATGTAFYFNNARMVRLSNINIQNYYRAMWFDHVNGDVGDVRLNTFRFDAMKDTSGAIGLYISGGGDEWNFKDGFIINYSTAQNTIGAKLEHAGGINWDQIDIAGQGKAMVIQPGANQWIRWVRMGGIQLDSSYGEGLYIDGSAAFATSYPAGIYGVSFVDCWLSSNAVAAGSPSGNGATIGDIQGLKILSSKIYTNTKHGIEIVGSGSKDILISGNDITANGNPYNSHTASTYSGIKVGNNVSGFTILGNIIRQAAGYPNNQKYAIDVGTGVYDYSIIGNDMWPNITAPYNDASCASTAVIRNNRPFNSGYLNACGSKPHPEGLATGTPTAGKSLDGSGAWADQVEIASPAENATCAPGRKPWNDGTYAYFCNGTNTVGKISLKQARFNTVTPGATATFNMVDGGSHIITLGQNTTGVFQNGQAGQEYTVFICQGGTPYTFTFPGNVHGAMNLVTPTPDASKCSVQKFHSPDGTSFWATAPGVLNQ